MAIQNEIELREKAEHQIFELRRRQASKKKDKLAGNLYSPLSFQESFMPGSTAPSPQASAGEVDRLQEELQGCRAELEASQEEVASSRAEVEVLCLEQCRLLARHEGSKAQLALHQAEIDFLRNIPGSPQGSSEAERVAPSPVSGEAGVDFAASLEVSCLKEELRESYCRLEELQASLETSRVEAGEWRQGVSESAEATLRAQLHEAAVDASEFQSELEVTQTALEESAYKQAGHNSLSPTPTPTPTLPQAGRTWEEAGPAGRGTRLLHDETGPGREGERCNGASRAR